MLTPNFVFRVAVALGSSHFEHFHVKRNGLWHLSGVAITNRTDGGPDEVINIGHAGVRSWLSSTLDSFPPCKWLSRWGLGVGASNTLRGPRRIRGAREKSFSNNLMLR